MECDNPQDKRNCKLSPVPNTACASSIGEAFKIKSFIFLDLETSHLETSDRPTIIEISLIAIHRAGLLHPDILPSLENARKPNDSSLDLSKLTFPRVADKMTLCLNPRKHTSPATFHLTKLDNLNLGESKKLPFDKGVISMLDLFLGRQDGPVCLVAHKGLKFDFPLLRTELARLDADDKFQGLYCVDSLEAFRADFARSENSDHDGNTANKPVPLKRKAPRDESGEDASLRAGCAPCKKESRRSEDQITSETSSSDDADPALLVSRMSLEQKRVEDVQRTSTDTTSSCTRETGRMENHHQNRPLSHQNAIGTASGSEAKSVGSPMEIAPMAMGALIGPSAGAPSDSPWCNTHTPTATPSSELTAATITPCSSTSLPNKDTVTVRKEVSPACFPHSTASAPLNVPSSHVTSSHDPQSSFIPSTASCTGTDSTASPKFVAQVFEPEPRRSPPPPPVKVRNPQQYSYVHANDKPPKVSYSLINIFKRTFGMQPPNSHAAEDDINSLIGVLLPRVQEFVHWADANATDFNKVDFYYRPRRPKRKLEF